jgi:hypothetical protein
MDVELTCVGQQANLRGILGISSTDLKDKTGPSPNISSLADPTFWITY